MNKVLQGIIIVAGRRTLNSYTVKVLKTVIQNLSKTYDFLKYITIKETVYTENSNIVSVSPDLDSIPSENRGKAIDAIIREVYMELNDDAVLYFIDELKDFLGNEFIQSIENLGVDLDIIQSEQHYLYSLRDRKVPKDRKERKPRRTDEEKKYNRTEEGLLNYSWNDVSTWNYDNTTCFLYKSDGKLLDSLHLDFLVEDYITRYTKYKEEPVSVTKMVEINRKDYEFLDMLYSRDMDIELATYLLKISKQKLNAIIDKLLELEMLHHVSDNEVKLTEKGINYLLEQRINKEER
jgi:arginyl-tRNA synthetase